MADKEKKAPATTQGKRRDGPAKAGKRKPPSPRYGKHLTTPESRARGRWLAGLFDARQPQHPRSELIRDDLGRLVRRDLPPQPRAARSEFLAKIKLGSAFVGRAKEDDAVTE